MIDSDAEARRVVGPGILVLRQNGRRDRRRLLGSILAGTQIGLDGREVPRIMLLVENTRDPVAKGHPQSARRPAIGPALAVLVLLGGCSVTEFEEFKESTSAFFRSVAEPATRDKRASAKKANSRTSKKSKGSRAAQATAPAGDAKQPLNAADPDKTTVTIALGHPSTQTVSPTAPADTPQQKADPSKLVGLDESQVVRLLGQPERVRSKPPGTVWSYTANGCSLDVFFYLDIASERFRVLAYEVNSTQVTQETKKVCLGRIQSAFRTE